ncbi:hypothetical protein [Kineobactrum salinum]|uniref:Uncharacterized protein n=1 Tax=Kineobactrum salinum TaxID=2708301 RepID=A0A6C0U523_9GAMM|nr:hypothetical protein [Kineobactrum salinum]QIB67211.1 hypothetical protein G3T16_19175 [Kineobactrum salinum]
MAKQQSKENAKGRTVVGRTSDGKLVVCSIATADPASVFYTQLPVRLTAVPE